MNWDDAMTWAGNLGFEGYSDWRLPTTLQPDLSCSGQLGSVSYGDGCTGSEMGHLYHTELGNLADSPLSNTGLFNNVQPNFYWSGTVCALCTGSAWYFFFDYGTQGPAIKSFTFYAWAVRDGDSAPIPEPGTIFLLGSGLAGLVLYRRRQLLKQA